MGHLFEKSLYVTQSMCVLAGFFLSGRAGILDKGRGILYSTRIKHGRHLQAVLSNL